MKTFFIGAAGAIVGTLLALILFVLIGFGIVGSMIGNLSKPAETPDAIVLSVDLRTPLQDQAPKSGLDVVLGNPKGFIDLVLAIDAAKDDEQVKGIFIRGAEFGIGSARAEELRSALTAFQAENKFVVAHSQGTYGGGPSSYRAISVADEIWVQPGSDLIADGIVFETLFLKGLFEKLSITPEFEALYEFKNAPNTYEESTYTESHRLAMTELAESIWQVSLSDIANDRELSIDNVRDALEAAPVSAGAMIDLKLADKSGWPEDAQTAALELAGEESGIVDALAYAAPSPSFGAPIIAVVSGQGPIVTGGAAGSLFSEGPAFASDAIAGSILEVAEDEDVQAIVFRVDSPGGSPTASDQIWRAIERAQTEYEKPVIVSMGSVAASGGYYVSAGADAIFANETTITGSIGIFGGKFAIADGLNRIGVNAESISIGGPFAGAFATTEKLSDEQRDRMRAWLTRGYDRFLEIVSEGRALSTDQAHEHARGRVWSGEDALERGLVDEIGGLVAAIDKAKSLAEIDAESEIRVVQYPLIQSGFPFGGAAAEASIENLAAIEKLSIVMSDPRVNALLDEIDASKTGHVQARIPMPLEN